MGESGILDRAKLKFIRQLSYLPISDRLYVKIRYRLTFGRKLNLAHPKAYTEKVQWIKLHALKPEYSCLADKFAARSIFARRAGEAYLVPLVGVYERVEDIPFEELPQKFVLKATHGSGWNIFCHSKDQLDIPRARRQLKIWLSSRYYWEGRETIYKPISPRIICEEMLPQPPGGLLEYKIICFYGKAQYFQVVFERFTNHTQNFYDLEWRRLPFTLAYPSHASDCPSPSKRDEMIELAEHLSAGIPLVRVDLYQVGEQILIGEMTFTPGNGFSRFDPGEWDYRIGDRLKLPMNS